MWKPKKAPIKTTVLLKGGYMGFHVSLRECTLLVVGGDFVGLVVWRLQKEKNMEKEVFV